MLEEIRRINEMGFRTDEDLPQWEQAFQQTTDADEDIPSCVGITKITRDLRSRPEVIRTFPVEKIHDLSTDRSRSR